MTSLAIQSGLVARIRQRWLGIRNNNLPTLPSHPLGKEQTSEVQRSTYTYINPGMREYSGNNAPISLYSCIEHNRLSWTQCMSDGPCIVNMSPYEHSLFNLGLVSTPLLSGLGINSYELAFR
ncbi:hypothetical protein BDDG_05202 [Blastomyces dermatitidis ATCC 18188]|uniref:Uncharacterized protein n=1 Tax=Ajellomyces dermatitidis (strain ATCC 18188 / CBS 674.68) TaxID=653446 RepID=F2TG96_AJEDA|nr:hypothetical protein BDDG_05202 [Blastomyces dermatitidis ATCC 18188]